MGKREIEHQTTQHLQLYPYLALTKISHSALRHMTADLHNCQIGYPIRHPDTVFKNILHSSLRER